MTVRMLLTFLFIYGLGLVLDNLWYISDDIITYDVLRNLFLGVILSCTPSIILRGKMNL